MVDTGKNVLEDHLRPLSFTRSAYDPLMAAVGNAQVVLIGDGTHGTYEFYAHRANITQALIEDKGFTAVAVEADWPDAFRINRYIHGTHTREGPIKNARAALDDFVRFPKWMWKNEVLPPFIDYLKQYNERIMRETNDASQKVSFYGMDLYSLHRSAEEVIKYLERVDPEGAKAARKRYNCFERFGGDTSRYAFETQFGLSKDCQDEVVATLKSMIAERQKYIERQLPEAGDKSGHPSEEQFMAEMNALVVRDAEEYYRKMMSQDTLSWNIRDDHFARTLVMIAQHLGAKIPGEDKQKKAKIVVWAHNSHVGDARATDMGRRRGEINVGQRCRELFGSDNVFNMGFLTNRGTVTAAYEWDEPPQLLRMNRPIEQSIEKVVDECSEKDTYFITHRLESISGDKNQRVAISQDLNNFLNRPRYERFIGVIYRSATEIPSHYSRSSIADQFDAVAQLKQTRGIQPLEPEDTWKGLTRGEYDLTFPFGE